MELVSFDLQRAKFLVGDLLAGRIAATVESRTYDETTSVGRVADQVDDRLVGSQRSAAPVDRDEGEEPVLDLVPLARTWRGLAGLAAAAYLGRAGRRVTVLEKASAPGRDRPPP